MKILGSKRMRVSISPFSNMFLLLAALPLLMGSGAVVATGSDDIPRATSETVYVPAYSRIHTHEKIIQPLASTLVIHNVDPKVAIELVTVRYHDHRGDVLREFLSKPMTLQPFQSGNFLTQISETAGGIGANYTIEWRSQDPALSPVIEAVMIGGSGTHGISFTSRGRVIARGQGIASE